MNYKNLQKNQQRSFNLSFRVIILSIFMLVIGGEFVTAQTDPDVENYNYVLGTQTIGPSYNFTNEDRLLETSKAIYAMGSRTLKISLDVSKYDGVPQTYGSLTELVRDNSSFRYALDMPFRDYFMWVRSNGDWADGYSETERSTDSIQIYNLTKHLLTQYNNTGKTFYLGHWEGDWYLLNGFDLSYVPSDARCANMAKWLRTRQNAIDKAKSEGGFSNVMVYGYVEVNRVPDAMDYGKKRVVNTVLPYTNVDFVSYSSYDAQASIQTRYNTILNYIESKLPPKPGIPGKRVFIGEVGNSFRKSGQDIIRHESENRALFKTAIAWGCPFVLYWEMYNNEIDASNRQIGYWLINDKNEKQPLYYTFTSFYEAAKQYVANFKLTNTRVPNSTEYAVWASNYLITKPRTYGQTRYVGGPTTAASATCPTGNVTTGATGTCTGPFTFIGNTIKGYVSSIDGTIATINLVKCDGTSLGTGNYNLKIDNVCGTVVKAGTVSGTNVPITISLNHTGIINYLITFTDSSGLIYYTNKFSITENCTSTNNVNAANIVFSNIQTTQATATWPSVPSAIGYRINYVTCAGTTFSFQDLPTSTNSYTLTGLAANTAYKIEIRAVFPDNCYSFWSGASDCFTTLCTSTDIVNQRLITFSNIQKAQATATWPSLPGAIGYRINFITCAGTTFSLQDLPTSSNSYTLTGLAPNTSYKIQTRAVFPNNCFGIWNGASDCFTTLCPSTDIVNQRLITFSNIQTTQATATWPSLPGAIGYRINFITCAGTTFSFQDLPTSTNSYTLTGLAPNTSYKIQTRAVFPNNCFGIWNGASDCFTTLSLPNSVLKERIDYSKSPSTVKGLLTTYEDPIQNNADVKIRGNKQMIILENDKTSGQVDVYSSDGRLVHSSKLLSDERKDISLPAGIYIIRIDKNNLISTHKIIL